MGRYKIQSNGQEVTVEMDSPPTPDEVDDILSHHQTIPQKPTGPVNLEDQIRGLRDQAIGGPVRYLADKASEYAPLASGMAYAQASLPLAPAAGPWAPLVPVAAFGIGAMAGKAGQQIYNRATGKPSPQTSLDAANDIGLAGEYGMMEQATGTLISPYIAKGLIGGTVVPPNVGEVSATLQAGPELGGLAGAIKNTAVRAGAQLHKIPETVSRWVWDKGVSKTLTPANLEPNAAVNALEDAQSFLQNIQSAGAKDVANAERSIIDSGQADKMFDTSGLSQRISEWMDQKGLTPGTATRELASNKDLLTKLDKVQEIIGGGQVRGIELLKVKRLLDAALKWDSSPLAPSDPMASQGLRTVANESRDLLNRGYEQLNSANKNASGAFSVADKYRKLFNVPDTGLQSSGTEDALRRIGREFVKNPTGASSELASDFSSVPASYSNAGGDVAAAVSDTTAARYYTPNSPVAYSPSSWLLKGASALGLTGGNMSKYSLQGAQGTAGALTGAANTAMSMPAATANMTPQFIRRFIVAPSPIAQNYESPK